MMSEIWIIPKKLEDLNERTKFLFFRDDPFRRFMIRSNEWLDFMERFYLWFSSNIELEIIHKLHLMTSHPRFCLRKSSKFQCESENARCGRRYRFQSEWFSKLTPRNNLRELDPGSISPKNRNLRRVQSITLGLRNFSSDFHQWMFDRKLPG